MAQFMLLLHDDPSRFRPYSPDEMQHIVQKYVAWRERLQQEGRYIRSNKLADDAGRVMRQTDSRVRVTDGPYSETKEWLGGFFAIEADDYDAAARIAESCPHLSYGGTIEIRRIER